MSHPIGPIANSNLIELKLKLLAPDNCVVLEEVRVTVANRAVKHFLLDHLFAKLSCSLHSLYFHHRFDHAHPCARFRAPLGSRLLSERGGQDLLGKAFVQPGSAELVGILSRAEEVRWRFGEAPVPTVGLASPWAQKATEVVPGVEAEAARLKFGFIEYILHGQEGLAAGGLGITFTSHGNDHDCPVR